jgi:hypothetical protein
MLKFTFPPLAAALCAAAVFTLSACNPTYNWREVRGESAPYSVMLPAKPASATRPITLDDTQVTMTMTAAEVDDVTFAVGTVELADEAQAQKALTLMKTALVKNINGTIGREQSPSPNEIAIEAAGAADARTGQRTMLFARFIAKGKRAYQVIVVGKERDIAPEQVDTFLTSFRPD